MADEWPDVGWVARLSRARAEAERCLHRLDASMRPLVDPATSGPARPGAMAAFDRDTMRLATELKRLCDLIVRRYPEAINQR